MKPAKPVYSILLILLMLATPLILLVDVAHAQAQGPGPATDEIIVFRVPEEEAGQALKTGRIDGYWFGVSPQTAQELAGTPGIELYIAPSGFNDIILNPAPVYTTTLNGTYDRKLAAIELGVPEEAIVYLEHTEDGKTYVELGAHPEHGINPFAFREVRYALNYAIDRKFIVDHIYLGYAIPMYFFLTHADPTYTIVADIAVKYEFEYNPDLADQIITSVLEKVGAAKIGGKWYYQGEPIKLTFLIRSEDERHEIGLIFASELEKLGFTIERKIVEFAQAIFTVYYSDPADFEWHLYTEGWGKGALDKWDTGTITQFTAPIGTFMPGWGEPSWWNYKNDTIDSMAQKISYGQYKSFEEYKELYRKVTEMGIQESIRIYVATSQTVYAVSENLKGVTLDLGAGLRSLFFTREIYVPDRNTVKLGHLWTWTARSVWNPFGGFLDVYSVDPMRATYDPMMWLHPFNGEPIAFRADFEVEADPTQNITLPSDAIEWNATLDKWVNVPPGTTARAKVTFDLSKYLGARWHHGVEITWGDVLASWVTNYEAAYDPEIQALEPVFYWYYTIWMDTIKGIRILPDQNKIEVYVDYYHFDPNYIAQYASFGMSNPAELQYIQFYLAFTEKTYALTSSRARRQNLPHLSLVIPEHVADVRAAAVNLTTHFPAEWFTVGGHTYMTQEEWAQRMTALINWIDTYNLAWVSNGPFKLTYFNKEEQELKLEANRDPTYPFKPGDWYFGVPTLTKIIDFSATTSIAPGDPIIINVTVIGVPEIKVEYVFRDAATGEILSTGMGEHVSGDLYRITIPGSVTAGVREFTKTYEVVILAYSTEVAMLDKRSEIITVSFAETLTRLQKQLEQMQTQTQEQLQNMQEQFANQLSQLQAQTQQQLQQVQQQLQQQLQQVQEALGASVAESFQQLSNSITQLGNTFTSTQQQLSNTLQQQFEQLSGTFTSSLQQVANAIGSVDNKLDTLGGKIDTLSTDISEGHDSLSNALSKLSDGIRTLTMLVGVLIVLELAALGLIFYTKK